MESLAGVLPRVLRRYGLDEGLAGWRAVEEWPRVVGSRIARHSRPAAFRDGILHVEVEGSAWLHELGYLKRDLLGRLHRHLGGSFVRDVRFTAARGSRH